MAWLRNKAMTKEMVTNLVRDAMKRKPEEVIEIAKKFNMPYGTAEELACHLWEHQPEGGVGFIDPTDYARFSNNKEEK